MVLSVSPILGFMGGASAADPLPPVADPIGAGNFCAGAPTTNPFSDVAAADPSVDEILCLVAAELTSGTTATTYSPNDTVTRRQMALFIKRVADLARSLEVTPGDLEALPAYDGTPDFSDHAAEDAAFEVAIGQLSQAGIVGGFPDGAFRPGAPVSRRQMAAFVNGLMDFLTGAPFADTGNFFDDDNGDSGEANLDALAAVGIFLGDGAGNVFPGSDLTRRQMANILLRYAQVLFDAGTIDGAFGPPPANVVPTIVTSGGPANASTSTSNQPAFNGGGADSDGTVVDVEAAINGGGFNSIGAANISGEPGANVTWSFISSTLPEGSNTVTFRSEDDDGAFSAPVTRTFTVNAVVPTVTNIQVRIAPLTNNIVVTFSEVVDCDGSGGSAALTGDAFAFTDQSLVPSGTDNSFGLNSTATVTQGATNTCVVLAPTSFGLEDYGTLAYAQPALANRITDTFGGFVGGFLLTANDSSPPSPGDSNATAAGDFFNVVIGENLDCSDLASTDFTATVNNFPATINAGVTNCTGGDTTFTLTLADDIGVGDFVALTFVTNAVPNQQGNFFLSVTLGEDVVA